MLRGGDMSGSKHPEDERDTPAKVMHVRMGRTTTESGDEFKSSSSSPGRRRSRPSDRSSPTKSRSLASNLATSSSAATRHQDLTLQSLDMLPNSGRGTATSSTASLMRDSGGGSSSAAAAAAAAAVAATASGSAVRAFQPSSGRRSTTDSFVDIFSEQRIIRLNVGGTVFATSRETLTRDQYCMLSVLVNGDMPSTRDESGAFFIDRDPTHFRFILNFLRDGAVDLPRDLVVLGQVLREAYFYQIEDLIRLVEVKRRRARRTPISRDSVLIMLHSAPRLQLPSTYMAGLNLSHLRLRESILMQADLTGADLSNCDCEKTVFTGACLKGASLSNTIFTEAKLDGCNLTGADLKKAQLYKCDLKGACLRSADLTRANLQDANLKGVNLQGANLQKTILIGADLRGFNLERANLQGANLEGARLQGVNLRHANLQGANLWNAFLQDANLTEAVLKDANLQRADMSGVTGTYFR